MLLKWYHRRPQRHGDGDPALRWGMDLHVPFHTLALDGVFARGADSVLGFYPRPPPTDAEAATVLRTIRRCMTYPRGRTTQHVFSRTGTKGLVAAQID